MEHFLIHTAWLAFLSCDIISEEQSERSNDSIKGNMSTIGPDRSVFQNKLHILDEVDCYYSLGQMLRLSNKLHF